MFRTIVLPRTALIIGWGLWWIRWIRWRRVKDPGGYGRFRHPRSDNRWIRRARGKNRAMSSCSLFNAIIQFIQKNKEVIEKKNKILYCQLIFYLLCTRSNRWHSQLQAYMYIMSNNNGGQFSNVVKCYVRWKILYYLIKYYRDTNRFRRTTSLFQTYDNKDSQPSRVQIFFFGKIAKLPTKLAFWLLCRFQTKKLV